MAQDPGGYKTQDGTFKGKLSYTSPEIFSGEKASPKSDVYATGVVLYQLLTGSNPFATKEISETIRRVLTVEPAPVRSRRGDVPPALSRIVAKAMSKNASGRYASAEAFARDLRRALIRREDQIFGELRDRVRTDFLGEMADAIGALSLHELDAAWQKSIRPLTEHASLTSSIRPQIAEQPTIDVRVHRKISQQLTTIERAPQPSNRRSVLAVVAAIVLTGGVTTAAILLTRSSAPAQRFLVVQAADGTAAGKPVLAVPPPAAQLPSLPSSAAAAAEGSDVPPLLSENQPRGTAAAFSSGGDDAGKLSRKFSERRGAVQQCFQTHTLVLEGTPSIGIRFQVDTAGHVISASIQPGDLASTALGQCLLGVARSTEFGPQPEARAFTIPIRARAVK
jgi:eukaryotic-like serine/threonine-protein kinase